VSRTVIREALRTVSAKGLIRIEKGRGIFVKDLSADTVSDPLHQYLKFKIERNYALDVIHARQIIEPSIAAFAALNRNEEDMEKLHDNIFRLKNFSGENSGLAKLDMEFHMQIAYASHNQVVPLILEPIHRLMPEIKKSVYATNEHAQDSAIEWHAKIVDEIVKGDPEGARSMMQKHLSIAEEHIQHMLRLQNMNSETR
jgi:GntR family transcriptional repressor for pyruvate dehydrogenase complex